MKMFDVDPSRPDSVVSGQRAILLPFFLVIDARVASIRLQTFGISLLISCSQTRSVCQPKRRRRDRFRWSRETLFLTFASQ